MSLRFAKHALRSWSRLPAQTEHAKPSAHHDPQVPRVHFVHGTSVQDPLGSSEIKLICKRCDTGSSSGTTVALTGAKPPIRKPDASKRKLAVLKPDSPKPPACGADKRKIL